MIFGSWCVNRPHCHSRGHRPVVEREYLSRMAEYGFCPGVRAARAAEDDAHTSCHHRRARRDCYAALGRACNLVLR